MSKIIATAAIKGAYQIVHKADKALTQAIESKGEGCKVEFPNTGYYLPIIYGMTGFPVRTLGDMKKALHFSYALLPPMPKKAVHLPYLGHTLDAGMAALFAEEVIEGIKYTEDPIPYTATLSPTEDNLWLGAADDIIMRERGVEFVDGSAPGFAAIAGVAPTNEIAVNIVRELQQKNLYIFLAGDNEAGDRSIANQLQEEGVEMGWPTRIVPFSQGIYGAVFALGFATRAALSFGGVRPGDYKGVLHYNKERVFAFVMALDKVDEEKYATAAGAINYGFPAIADTDIPQILPTGVCTYEHVIANVPHDKIVDKCVEVRGLKVKVSEIPIPVAYGPAFEGERIRRDDTYVEMGGQKTPAFEFLYSTEMDDVQDNKITVNGPEVEQIEAGARLPLGIVVKVAGRKMQTDFEPIIERQIHDFINRAEGVLHIGQRDINWIRIGKKAAEKGFKIQHLGHIIYSKIKEDFSEVVDKVEVTIYTEEKDVLDLREQARETYRARDARTKGLTDEKVDTFYSCLLCQSFAPTHACVISPERPGLCGAYSWFDGKAAYEMTPTGPNQPIPIGEMIDGTKGEWQGVNTAVFRDSRQGISRFTMYSLMDAPTTSCGCFEAITVFLPRANGIMVVNREHSGMTPCGMKFSTLAGTVGGGLQSPGFMGMSKLTICSKKFVSAEGGTKRIVWLPKELKDQIRENFQEQADEIGIPDFLDKYVADETIAETEEELIKFLEEVKHPCLEMEPMV